VHDSVPGPASEARASRPAIRSTIEAVVIAHKHQGWPLAPLEITDGESSVPGELNHGDDPMADCLEQRNTVRGMLLHNADQPV